MIIILILLYSIFICVLETSILLLWANLLPFGQNKNAIKSIIAPTTKFNGPHIITKDTIINVFNIDNNTNVKYIPSGYYCLIRVKSWWSDIVKCEGSIKVIQKADLNEENII